MNTTINASTAASINFDKPTMADARIINDELNRRCIVIGCSETKKRGSRVCNSHFVNLTGLSAAERYRVFARINPRALAEAATCYLARIEVGQAFDSFEMVKSERAIQAWKEYLSGSPNKKGEMVENKKYQDWFGYWKAVDAKYREFVGLWTNGVVEKYSTGTVSVISAAHQHIDGQKTLDRLFDHAVKRIGRKQDFLYTEESAKEWCDRKIGKLFREEKAELTFGTTISPYDTREAGDLEVGTNLQEVGTVTVLPRNFLEVPTGGEYDSSEDEYARLVGAGDVDEFFAHDDEQVDEDSGYTVADPTVSTWDEKQMKFEEMYATLHDLFFNYDDEEVKVQLRRAYTLAGGDMSDARFAEELGITREDYRRNPKWAQDQIDTRRMEVIKHMWMRRADYHVLVELVTEVWPAERDAIDLMDERERYDMKLVGNAG